MDENPFLEPSLNLNRPTGKRFIFRLLLLIFAVVVVTVIIFAGSKFLNNNKINIAGIMNSVSPTKAAKPTSAPTSVPSPAPTELKGKKATPTPTKGTEKLAKSELTVIVQNGSGVAGAAGKIATTIRTAGYRVASTGNADAFTYEGVTIRVKKSSSAYLQGLKKDLSSYTITKATSDLPESNTSDAVIIIGK